MNDNDEILKFLSNLQLYFNRILDFRYAFGLFMVMLHQEGSQQTRFLVENEQTTLAIHVTLVYTAATALIACFELPRFATTTIALNQNNTILND